MEISKSDVPVGETSNVFGVSGYGCQQMSEHLIQTAAFYRDPEGPITFSSMSVCRIFPVFGKKENKLTAPERG